MHLLGLELFCGEERKAAHLQERIKKWGSLMRVEREPGTIQEFGEVTPSFRTPVTAHIARPPSQLWKM